MALTKADLTKAVQRRSPMSCNRASLLIHSLIQVIKKTLESGQDIPISRFGKFPVRKRNTGHGINSKTGNDLWLDTRIYGISIAERSEE